MSSEFHLEDMVYQGTVLGPQLWNVLFSDISDLEGAPDGFYDANCADDFTACKKSARMLRMRKFCWNYAAAKLLCTIGVAETVLCSILRKNMS